MFSILLLAAVVASTYTLGKAALAYTTPIFLIATRMLIAGLCFGFYYAIRYKAWPKLSKSQWVMLAQITFFGFYLGFILEFWALQYLTSSKTALLYSLSPFVAALLSYWVFSERMTRKKFLGLGIGLLGFLPAVMSSGPGEQELGKTLFSLPELAILIAVGAFAYGWVLIRKLLKSSKIHESFVTSFGMVAGGIAALLTSMLLEWHGQIPVSNIYNFALLAGGLIILGNILGYILYNYTLKHYTATLMTFAEMLIPLFAALYGWLFLGETVGIYFFASLTLFLIGMYIFYREEKRLGYFMEQ